MRTLVFGLFALSLSACAGPHLTAATPAGGIVSSYGWQPNKALLIAQDHCAKSGKSAVVTSENDLQDHMTFECK
jgi:hypothetical protein